MGTCWLFEETTLAPFVFLRLYSESLLYSPSTSRARNSESSDPADAATDVKHARAVIEPMGFDVKTSRPAPTPGSTSSHGKADSAGGQLRNAADELDEEDRRANRSAAGTLLHHALDRPDIQFSTGRCLLGLMCLR